MQEEGSLATSCLGFEFKARGRPAETQAGGGNGTRPFRSAKQRDDAGDEACERIAPCCRLRQHQDRDDFAAFGFDRLPPAGEAR